MRTRSLYESVYQGGEGTEMILMLLYTDVKQMQEDFGAAEEFSEGAEGFKGCVRTFEDIQAFFGGQYDFEGFNLPRVELDKFKAAGGQFRHEIPDDVQYICAALIRDMPTQMHELAHGLFYLDMEFQQHVTRWVLDGGPDKLTGVKRELLGWGYSENTDWADEMFAYAVDTAVCINGGDEVTVLAEIIGKEMLDRALDIFKAFAQKTIYMTQAVL